MDGKKGYILVPRWFFYVTMGFLILNGLTAFPRAIDWWYGVFN